MILNFACKNDEDDKNNQITIDDKKNAVVSIDPKEPSKSDLSKGTSSSPIVIKEPSKSDLSRGTSSPPIVLKEPSKSDLSKGTSSPPIVVKKPSKSDLSRGTSSPPIVLKEPSKSDLSRGTKSDNDKEKELAKARSLDELNKAFGMSRIDYETERNANNPKITKLDLIWDMLEKYKGYIWPLEFKNQVNNKTVMFNEQEFWIWSKEYLINKYKLLPEGLDTIDDYYAAIKD